MSFQGQKIHWLSERLIANDLAFCEVEVKLDISTIEMIHDRPDLRLYVGITSHAKMHM